MGPGSRPLELDYVGKSLSVNTFLLLLYMETRSNGLGRLSQLSSGSVDL